MASEKTLLIIDTDPGIGTMDISSSTTTVYNDDNVGI